MPSPQALVGLEWTIARLAADMRVFGFGPVREIQARVGTGTVGVLALHVQCPWRLTGPNGIITGTGDLYRWDGPGDEPDDWSPHDGGSAQNARLDELLGPRQRDDKAFHYKSGLHVETVSFVPAVGDLSLTLGRGYELQVFPDSVISEQWRLFTPEGGHLVWPPEQAQPA